MSRTTPRSPNRVAFKHAHSQQNPEQDWGTNTLQAIVFAFYVLNEQFGYRRPGGVKRIVLDRRNTLVIASGDLERRHRRRLPRPSRTASG